MSAARRPPLYTLAARDDLRGIVLHIARDNPARAASFVAELRAHCGRIGLDPLIHGVRAELGGDIRVAVHRSYLILYAFRDDGRVVIERIVHGARDLPHLLEP